MYDVVVLCSATKGHLHLQPSSMGVDGMARYGMIQSHPLRAASDSMRATNRARESERARTSGYSMGTPIETTSNSPRFRVAEPARRVFALPIHPPTHPSIHRFGDPFCGMGWILKGLPDARLGLRLSGQP